MKCFFCNNFRVCARSVAVAVIVSVSCLGQSLTVTPTTNSVTIYPGQQEVALGVSTSGSAYGGPITLTLKGLPSGITVPPVMLTAGDSGTLRLSASLS